MVYDPMRAVTLKYGGNPSWQATYFLTLNEYIAPKDTCYMRPVASETLCGVDGVCDGMGQCVVPTYEQPDDCPDDCATRCVNTIAGLCGTDCRAYVTGQPCSAGVPTTCAGHLGVGAVCGLGCSGLSDCGATDGWVNVGDPTPCCNHLGQSCTSCQEQVYVTFECDTLLLGECSAATTWRRTEANAASCNSCSAGEACMAETGSCEIPCGASDCALVCPAATVCGTTCLSYDVDTCNPSNCDGHLAVGCEPTTCGPNDCREVCTGAGSCDVECADYEPDCTGVPVPIFCRDFLPTVTCAPQTCTDSADCPSTSCKTTSCGGGWQDHGSSPNAPRTPGMVFDRKWEQMVLFGGAALSGTTLVRSSATWVRQGGIWIERTDIPLAARPAPRFLHKMAYDELRQRTVLFGGSLASNQIVGDTWEWDGVSAMWVQASPPNHPSRRIGHAMAYHATPWRQATVLFGGWTPADNGLPATELNDTWVWDGTTWTNVTGLSTVSPSPRRGAAMAFDAARGVTVLFGGGLDPSTNTVNAELWEWDGVSWKQVPRVIGNPWPVARREHAMAYDPARGGVVMYGGTVVVSGTPMDDMWLWDGTSWTDISTVDLTRRFAHVMAYDATEHEIVLYGGVNLENSLSQYYPETWSWSGVAGGCWSVDDGTCLPVRLSAGLEHICMVTIFGSVYCWGKDTLGTGKIDGPSGRFVAVASGDETSCAIADDGTVHCWGAPLGGTMPSGGHEWSQITVGGNRACVRNEFGEYHCWGASDAMPAEGPHRFTHLSAGTGHTCGLKPDGTVMCWGDDAHGKALAPEGIFRTVSAGDQHSCAIEQDSGKIVCWGAGAAAVTDEIREESRFVKLSGGLGYDLSCAIDTEGDIHCWGETGELEDNPIPAEPDNPYIYVSVGGENVIGLREDYSFGSWLGDSAFDPPAACTYSTECTGGAVCVDGFCIDYCAGVSCGTGGMCYGGSCFPACVEDLDCDPELCFDGRCAPADNPCLGLEDYCPSGHICYYGTCFPTCTDDDVCDPGHVCYDGRCAPVDNACAGVVCGTSYVCFGGGCFLDCSDEDLCDDDHVCYAGRCIFDACSEDGLWCPDPCDDVTCGTSYVCVGGGCFLSCSDDDMCDPGHVCYAGRCGPVDDPCAGLVCDRGYACFGGACFLNCSDDDMCDEDHICYAGRCTPTVCDDEVAREGCRPDACAGVICGTAYVCHEGGCFLSCTDDEMCDEDHVCYAGRCILDDCDTTGLWCPDPCGGVTCGAGYVCHGGGCFLSCTDDDMCDPGHICYAGRCVANACDGIICDTGDVCYMGTCFVPCGSDEDCSFNPDHACYNGRCATSPCQGVSCPTGYRCDPDDGQGTCTMDCSTHEDCDPDHHCYQGWCRSLSCDEPDPVTCHPGQSCYLGTCFYDCGEDDRCDAENHFCYEGRCATDSCAALITGYDNDDQVYRAMGGMWPTLVQRSYPWMRPRPKVQSAASMPLEINQATTGASRLTSPKRGRVVLFLDRTTRRYYLLLAQGDNHVSQGAAGATFSVRYFDMTEAPSVRRIMGSDTSYLFKAAVDAEDFHHHQIQLRANGTSAEGLSYVVLAGFPADRGWTLRISAAFRGDIEAWEFYSAESGRWLEIDAREELELSNVEIPEGTVLTEEVGVWECEPVDSHGEPVPGICSRGSTIGCMYGWLECAQTVLPYDYEVCDGRDVTCDGAVDNIAADADPEYGLRVPMVYVRQEGVLAEWTRWPTVERSARAFDFMGYAPHGADYGEGSTDVRAVDSTTRLQQADHSLAFFHRDASTGVLTMPLVHGMRISGTFASDAQVRMHTRFANDLDSDAYDYSDLLFASWADDWMPLRADGTPDLSRYGDAVPVQTTYETYGMNSVLRRMEVDGSPGRESDAVMLQLIWQNGASIKPLRFDIVPGAFSDSIDYWRLYRPYTALRNLHPTRPLEVKVEWMPIDKSTCMSDTIFDGCRMVPYVCVDGQLVCPEATEELCGGCRDRDGDGYLGYDGILCPEGDDCDDSDARVYPGAKERCDGKDTNCDGFVDAIGPAALAEYCPDGAELCGPEECNYRMICTCSGADCFCRGTLEEGEEHTSGQPARAMMPVDGGAGEQDESLGSVETNAAGSRTACATSRSHSSPAAVPLALLGLLGACLWRRRRLAGPGRRGAC
jgi:hypothetical protein